VAGKDGRKMSFVRTLEGEEKEREVPKTQKEPPIGLVMRRKAF